MALPSVASASEMAPPTARAGSSREQPWADRAPWGLQTTEDRGRSRELRREPVRGAACQSGMHQFVWCSGTHRVAWRSTMPETVALAILRFGSRCHRAIWINSHCWNDHTLVEWLRGWVRSPEVLTRPRSSAQGSQTFGFPPYAIVGRDDHFDWLSYKFAKASTHS